MSEPMPDFQLHRPTTTDEAVAIFSGNETARICAGGTDLLVNMRHGLVETDTLIDITNIAELKTIKTGKDGATLGAGVTLADLAANADIAAVYPAITQAALSIAAPGHRNAATIGGNLCLDTRCLYYNQSHWWRKSNDFCLKYRGDVCHVAPAGKKCRAAFSGDLAPALLVHGASIDIIGPNGKRTIPLVELYNEDGAEFLTLEPGEILTTIHLPTATKSAYTKVRVRGAIDFPLAGVGVAVKDNQPIIALTGTNSCPVLVEGLEPLSSDDDIENYFTVMEKRVRKTVTPLRTTTIEAQYRRLSIASLAIRLARQLLNE